MGRDETQEHRTAWWDVPTAADLGQVSPGPNARGGARVKEPDDSIQSASAAVSVAPTPAHSEEFARTSNRLTVGDYLPRAAHDGSAAAGKCEWSSHVAVSLTPEEAGALAWVLIDTIMRARFGPAAQPYETWRRHTLAGTTIPPRQSHDRPKRWT